MISWFSFGRDSRVNALLGAGHFLSHFYQLCLPPVFIAWQQAFDVSFAELGLAMAVMSAAAALMQTPMGFLVDRYGARPFLVGGTLLMTLSIAGMGFATAYWQIVVLALISGVGNSVIHPADYAILSGSVGRAWLGRSFAFHTFVGHIGFAAAPPATAALMLLFGWRGALIFVGLLGLPVVATILWQSRILVDQARRPQRRAETALSGTGLLFSARKRVPQPRLPPISATWSASWRPSSLMKMSIGPMVEGCSSMRPRHCSRSSRNTGKVTVGWGAAESRWVRIATTPLA